MNLIQRVAGVFSSPKAVFASLAEKPVWIDVLVLTLVAIIAFSLVITPFMQKDQLQMMRDNAKLKERLGEEQFNRMIQTMENPPAGRRIIQTYVFMPLFFIVFLLFQALILMIMGRFVSTQGTYVQVLSALLHAGLINSLLGNGVRLVLALTRKSVMQTSTSLALLFPKLEITSKAFALLGQVDFFQLWLFGVLAYGLSAIFKVDLKKSLFIAYSFWFLKALVNVALTLIGMSFLR